LSALENPVLLAQIGAAHGVKGEVRVKAFGDPEALGDYGSLWAEDGRKFKIVRMRPSKTVLVVKFKGVNSRNDAEALNGLELFVGRSALPDDIEDDEFYITDLIGCDVMDEGGAHIGTVMNVADFGAGDLLEISPHLPEGGLGGEHWYLPFTQANVQDVDLEKHAVTICKPCEVSERDPD